MASNSSPSPQEDVPEEDAAAPAASFASQQHAKMLERLRDELIKLRKINAEVAVENETLKESNQKLMDAHSSAGRTFAGFVDHSKKLNETNEKLTAENADLKSQVSKLKLSQEELKEEVKMKNATYVAEVHSRLELQETLVDVVDTVEERCRDKKLVNDILAISGNARP